MEKIMKPKNGVYDVGEIFFDFNNDGIYNGTDLFIASAADGTGPFQEGATFTDSGDYSAEEYGWGEEENIRTVFNDDEVALFSYLDANNNGKFDFLYNPDTRQFVADSTEEFAFIDSDENGLWDATNEGITLGQI